MFPGSLVERNRACGRPNCHCADGKDLHSPALWTALPGVRNLPQHHGNKLLEAVLRGALMHIPILLKIEAECREEALAKPTAPNYDDPTATPQKKQKNGSHTSHPPPPH